MRTVRYICMLLVAISTGISALSQVAPQFSADFISRKSRDTTTGRMYLGQEKFRMDMHSVSGRQGGIIVDLRSRKTFVLMPLQQMYVQIAPNDSSSENITAVLPQDRTNPCIGWTKCRKIGQEKMNDRLCDRWELTDFRGTRTVWIDTRLGIYVKTLAADGTTTELTNVHEGVQPRSRFEIPAGYTEYKLRSNRGQ